MWAAFKALSIGSKIGIAISTLLLFASIIGSTYFVAYNKGLNVSKLEISKYENKVLELNNKLTTAQAKVDVRVVTEYKDRVNVIDRIVYVNRNVIKTVVPEQFNLSRGWVYAYNQSVQGLEIDPVLASDATPSTTSEMIALADTIIPNNGICLSNAAKLSALQDLVKQREAAKNEVTK